MLYRDNHTCQHCHGRSKDTILEVHHLKSRQIGGDRPENLIALCATCHKKVSQGKLKLQVKPSQVFKAETFMTTIRWQLVEALKNKGNCVSVTYGYITKSKRIALGLYKSHSNDAFLIADGRDQERTTLFLVTQNRRHNRSLQTNRKGFKPAIRRQRYPYHPGDLVLLGKLILAVKGMFNYGKWVRLMDSTGKTYNIASSKVKLLKYQRGFSFVSS